MGLGIMTQPITLGRWTLLSLSPLVHLKSLEIAGSPPESSQNRTPSTERF